MNRARWYTNENDDREIVSAYPIRYTCTHCDRELRATETDIADAQRWAHTLHAHVLLNATAFERFGRNVCDDCLEAGQ